jgi:hypothetical protein
MSGGMKNVERLSQEKNITRQKPLQKRTRANQEQYLQAKKEAHEICKEKKKQLLNNRTKPGRSSI